MINCNCFNELMLKAKTFLNEGFEVNDKTGSKVILTMLPVLLSIISLDLFNVNLNPTRSVWRSRWSNSFLWCFFKFI